MTTIREAKVEAERREYFFYFDRDSRMWACYPKNLSKEASYHTKATLRQTELSQFVNLYLED